MEKTKIRVGSVSYLNAKPLIHGFENNVMKDDIELIIDYPSEIAKQLLENKIDIGLVPIAIIPQLKEHYIVTDFCIGCNGEVATVCLFSDVPVSEIKTVYLDYQSKTSVALLKVLLREHWKISPVLVDATAGYEEKIKDTTAGLVIGDRAFTQRLRSKFYYDLGKAWKEMTGMPFVFAAWVANKKISETWLREFNKANRESLQNIEEVINDNQYTDFDIKKYFTEFIDYNLDNEKRNALKVFLDILAQPTVYQTDPSYNE